MEYICENCTESHSGEYGSGRFCSSRCAKSFSTKESRLEINKRVSKTLKEKFSNGELSFCFSPEMIEKRKKSYQASYEEKLRKELENPWDELGPSYRRKKLILEQEGACNKCKLVEWLGQPITLELEHIDGDSQNNSRENVELLCPNCHSLTPTWRGRNKNGNKQTVLDSEIYPLIEEGLNNHQILLFVGLSAKGTNYRRIRRLRENLIARRPNTTS